MTKLPDFNKLILKDLTLTRRIKGT